MSILAAIEKDYPIIHKAAGEFIKKLTGTNIKKDIALAAGVGGLTLLRARGIDFSKLNPAGSILLGAVPDQVYDEMQRFIYGWIISNGLKVADVNQTQIPDDAKSYNPEIAALEKQLREICLWDNIKVEHIPFVAVSAALMLVATGQKLGLLDAGTGQMIVIYHMISGSKTIPYSSNI